MLLGSEGNCVPWHRVKILLERTRIPVTTDKDGRQFWLPLGFNFVVHVRQLRGETPARGTPVCAQVKGDEVLVTNYRLRFDFLPSEKKLVPEQLVEEHSRPHQSVCLRLELLGLLFGLLLPLHGFTIRQDRAPQPPGRSSIDTVFRNCKLGLGELPIPIRITGHQCLDFDHRDLRRGTEAVKGCLDLRRVDVAVAISVHGGEELLHVLLRQLFFHARIQQLPKVSTPLHDQARPFGIQQLAFLIEYSEHWDAFALQKFPSFRIKSNKALC
mmetsp:Transcript_3558/g.6807  ORF Transcript_3558/g.6807 Transcript_3558/m.6807 type:complete len:270 (+) Transcript_3558:436-1245(+)